MMRYMRILVLGLVTAVALAGCTIGQKDTELCKGEGVLLEDDFSDETGCGWALYNQAGTEVAISEGVMSVSTSQPGEFWWSNPGRDFSDVIITVNARQINGPDDNAYGIICRYENPHKFYIFLVSGDGFYVIGKFDGEGEPIDYLTEDSLYVYSDVINRGIATNQIRASCIGDELSLSVNGLPLLTVTDESFDSGDVGLGVSTLDLGTAVVNFDNIKIIAP